MDYFLCLTRMASHHLSTQKMKDSFKIILIIMLRIRSDSQTSQEAILFLDFLETFISAGALRSITDHLPVWSRVALSQALGIRRDLIVSGQVFVRLNRTLYLTLEYIEPYLHRNEDLPVDISEYFNVRGKVKANSSIAMVYNISQRIPMKWRPAIYSKVINEFTFDKHGGVQITLCEKRSPIKLSEILEFSMFDLDICKIIYRMCRYNTATIPDSLVEVLHGISLEDKLSAQILSHMTDDIEHTRDLSVDQMRSILIRVSNAKNIAAMTRAFELLFQQDFNKSDGELYDFLDVRAYLQHVEMLMNWLKHGTNKHMVNTFLRNFHKLPGDVQVAFIQQGINQIGDVTIYLEKSYKYAREIKATCLQLGNSVNICKRGQPIHRLKWSVKNVSVTFNSFISNTVKADRYIPALMQFFELEDVFANCTYKTLSRAKDIVVAYKQHEEPISSILQKIHAAIQTVNTALCQRTISLIAAGIPSGIYDDFGWYTHAYYAINYRNIDYFQWLIRIYRAIPNTISKEDASRAFRGAISTGNIKYYRCCVEADMPLTNRDRRKITDNILLDSKLKEAFGIEIRV